MHCSVKWLGVLPWYVQVVLGLYHFGKGGWWILPEDITTIRLATRDGKRSSYVIGIGVNSGVGLGGKFLIALEPVPKWALPVGRVGVGAVAWRASLWMGAGALVCTGAELEESSA